MRKWTTALVLTLAVALVAFAAAWGSTQAYLHAPAGSAASVVVQVARGNTLRPVLTHLEHEGVIEHSLWLYAYARLRGHTGLREGTYVFSGTQTPLEILENLQAGRVQLEAVTLPEGLNRWQMRALFATAGWMTPAQFDQLCDDPAFLASHHVFGPTCDGYLYPETYKFARGVPPAAIFATMFASFHAAFAAATAAGRGPLQLEPRALVTLASIVEKETAQPSERPRIACVFYNRLRGHPPWRLETDPTVIYAATLANPAFDGNLTRDHLHNLDSPYNTYRTVGLPPGPIASPGRAALQAVVAPATCRDYFFVANNRGGHIFCPTLTCHNAAVQRHQIDYFRAARGRRPPSTP